MICEKTGELCPAGTGLESMQPVIMAELITAEPGPTQRQFEALSATFRTAVDYEGACDLVSGACRIQTGINCEALIVSALITHRANEERLAEQERVRAEAAARAKANEPVYTPELHRHIQRLRHPSQFPQFDVIKDWCR